MSALKTFALCLALSLPGCAALAPSTILQVAAQVRPAASYLGVSVVETNTDGGVQVIRVANDSPAFKAGLKPGDVLLSYNGETILSAQQLGRLVWETPPGRHIHLQYSRDGKTATITVITAPPPIAVHSVDSDPSPNWDTGFGGALTDVPIPSIAWRNMPLGIEYEELSSQLAPAFGVRDGLLIRAVEPGSVSDKAGVKPGDVLVEVNGHPIAGRQDLSAVCRIQGTANAPVQLEVVRGRKRIQLTFQVGG